MAPQQRADALFRTTTRGWPGPADKAQVVFMAMAETKPSASEKKCCRALSRTFLDYLQLGLRFDSFHYNPVLTRIYIRRSSTLLGTYFLPELYLCSL